MPVGKQCIVGGGAKHDAQSVVGRWWLPAGSLRDEAAMLSMRVGAIRRLLARRARRRAGAGYMYARNDADAIDTAALVREGELVRLRAHVPANRAAFQRWYADEEIAQLLRHDLEPLTEIQSRGYFDTIILPLSARGLCYAIHEASTDRLIGTAALTDVTSGVRSGLFRIVIGDKASWGRGYGTEATRLVVEEAFERHGLNQVRLEVFRHNERALAAYRRVGFQITGEHTEWVSRRQRELHVVEMAIERATFFSGDLTAEPEPGSVTDAGRDEGAAAGEVS